MESDAEIERAVNRSRNNAGLWSSDDSPVLSRCLPTPGAGLVGRDQLIEVLSEDDPPATAINGVQQQIAGPRRQLGRSAIATAGTGYQPTVDVELDSRAFADEVRSARKAFETDGRASGSAVGQALRAALGRWRGIPSAEVPDTRYVRTERTRLEELRLQAQELRLDAALAEGDHATVLGDLPPLLAGSPHREHVRALQIRALHRSGRTVDAREAYRTARQRLVDRPRSVVRIPSPTSRTFCSKNR